VKILNYLLSAELQRLEVKDHEPWFQLDAATSHTVCISMAVLRKNFLNHVISRNGDIDWSPALTLLDLFLWGLFEIKLCFE
jgi:hypothetical protein